MTKKEEILLFKKICEFEPFKSILSYEISERPDFICLSKTKKIGVEITESYQDDSKQGSTLKKTRIIKKNFGELLAQNLKLNLPCYIQLDFKKILKYDKERFLFWLMKFQI